MDLDLLRVYLEERTGTKFLVGPDIPDMPDEIGVLTQVPGLGLMNDGLVDRPQVLVQIRSGQNKQYSGEATAKLVDDLIVFGDYPHELWGSWVINAHRAGGAPAPGPLDPGRRVTYTCTYTVQEATDL